MLWHLYALIAVKLDNACADALQRSASTYDPETKTFKKDSVSIQHSCLPLKIRESIYVTISKTYIVYKINKAGPLSIFLLVGKSVCLLTPVVLMCDIIGQSERGSLPSVEEKDMFPLFI